ncbi:MAG: hypothetical protein RR780_09180 [Cellulosilyticaceae bacterium]
MKKCISVLLMLVVLVTSSMSVFAQTTPAIEKSTEVVQVYNGFGEFVGTIDFLCCSSLKIRKNK